MVEAGDEDGESRAITNAIPLNRPCRFHAKCSTMSKDNTNDYSTSSITNSNGFDKNESFKSNSNPCLPRIEAK